MILVVWKWRKLVGTYSLQSINSNTN